MADFPEQAVPVITFADTEEQVSVASGGIKGRPAIQRAGFPTGWKESLNGKNWKLTTWFRVTCWRKLAEATNQFMENGSQVLVKGELRSDASDGSQNPRIWQGNDAPAARRQHRRTVSARAPAAAQCLCSRCESLSHESKHTPGRASPE